MSCYLFLETEFSLLEFPFLNPCLLYLSAHHCNIWHNFITHTDRKTSMDISQKVRKRKMKA